MYLGFWKECCLNRGGSLQASLLWPIWRSSSMFASVYANGDDVNVHALFRWATVAMTYIAGNDYKTRFPTINECISSVTEDDENSSVLPRWVEKLNKRPAVKKIATDRAAVQTA